MGIQDCSFSIILLFSGYGTFNLFSHQLRSEKNSAYMEFGYEENLVVVYDSFFSATMHLVFMEVAGVCDG